MGFNPYSANGGTILGIAGEDYAIIASDTRLCEERYYMINSRENSHVYPITPKLAVGATGFQGDTLTLMKVLKSRVMNYGLDHGKLISTNAFAAMLSTILYSRRFFPFYVNNIVAGLDENGKGAIYSYDCVGSYERESYRAGGSSSSILQPFLDSQVGGKNRPGDKPNISKEDALKLVKDIFISAAERDIHCGDGLVIHLITSEGTEIHNFPLRKD